MRIVEGSSVSITESFLDSFDEPLYPAHGDLGPIVTLFDPVSKLQVTQIVATVGEDPGSWTADMAIPILDLLDEKRFIIEWRYDSEEGIQRLKSEVIVEPASNNLITDIVTTNNDETFDVVLPIRYQPIAGDTLTVSLILNNEPVFQDESVDQDEIECLYMRAKTCAFRIPSVQIIDRLEPFSLIFKYRSARHLTDRYITYKVWIVTPQILLASSLVEDHINKARAQNVIPELEYSQADLIQYLYRGLALFNATGPRITGFRGTNMQGTILDAWVTCSCYYALGAQLQAEGQLAFDFTGQQVNLNMDRTPSIEAALGRIEGLIQGSVLSLKKQLSKAGQNQGDGSVGARPIDGSRAFGTLGVTNSPLSKMSGRHGIPQWTRASPLTRR